MQLGDRVRNARINAGMTQYDLARLLNCSIKTINRIEHNNRELTINEISIINNALGTDVIGLEKKGKEQLQDEDCNAKSK